MSYAHARPTRIQFDQDLTQVLRAFQRVPVVLWRHVFGIVTTVVALLFTGGVAAGFWLDGDEFASVLSALIGLTSIAIGITYHSMEVRPRG